MNTPIQAEQKSHASLTIAKKTPDQPPHNHSAPWYELTTIKDIFEQIPPERLADFFAELTEMMLQAHSVQKIVDAAAQKGSFTQFGSTITWVDDGVQSVSLLFKNRLF